MLSAEEKLELGRRLRSVRRGFDELNDEEFYGVVDRLAGHIDLDVARTLTETFSDASEDDGTQEAVCSVLATALADVRIRAILEGLVRLRRDAPSWVPCLVEGETRSNPDLVVKIANEVPRDVREILAETRRRSIEDGARGGAVFERVLVGLKPPG